MEKPVFISYARTTSSAYAEQLRRALGARAFLDTHDLEAGQRFPPELIDALLGAQVVVVFADEVYFRKWYCLWELRTALEPYQALGGKTDEASRRAALASIVVALPSAGKAPDVVGRLPPALAETRWPKADDITALVGLIEKALGRSPEPLGENVDACGGSRARTRARLLDVAANVQSQSLAGFRPLYPLQLPGPSIDSFYGRADDLHRIDFVLSTLRGGVEGAALTGAVEAGGGVGKTRLALEYLHRFGRRNYPGGIFWVDAAVSNDDLEKQLHGILATLQPDVPDLGTFHASRREVTPELEAALHEAAGKGEIIYVVDNLPEERTGTSRRPLSSYCPALGKVALLVTSRRSLRGAEGVFSLRIDTLSPEAAVRVLTHELARADLDALTEEGWKEIAAWVGNLPLALVLLNRALKLSATSPSDLSARARNKGPVEELERQIETIQDSVDPRFVRGVVGAFSISYQLLSPPVQRAARVLAQLSPSPVPRAVLDAEPELFTDRVRKELSERSFITPVEEIGPADSPGRGRPVAFFGAMHRVLADYLRSCEQAQGRDREDVIRVLNNTFSRFVSNDPSCWPLLGACAPHVERVLGSNGEVASGEPSEATSLQGSFGRFLYFYGDYGAARGHLERALETRGRVHGEEHPDTLTVRTNLATTLRAQGDYGAARGHEEQVLEVRERVHGKEHPDALTARANLAATLRAQGDYGAARGHLEQVLEARERVLGKEHRDTLTARANLAATFRAQGDYGAARGHEEQVLEARERVLGKEHSDTLTARANLAATLKAQGDYGASRRHLEQVLEARERMLGKEHPDTLMARANLAVTLKAQGDYGAARGHLERVLEARERVLGKEHPNTLTARGNLAATLRAQGDYGAARGHEEKVLEARERVLGKEHPDTLTARANLAMTLREQGDCGTARGNEEQVLEARERVLGKEHPDTLTARANLAETLRVQGDYGAARRHLEQVLEARERVLGKEHPDTLTVCANLAATLGKQGK